MSTSHPHLSTSLPHFHQGGLGPPPAPPLACPRWWAWKPLLPLRAAPDWSVLWDQNYKGKGQVSWLLETNVCIFLPTTC